MEDPKPPFHEPGSPEAQAAMKEFIHSYGMALAAWAQLEDTLCELFHRLIHTAPAMARALFFSGRSFATRADLYSAAIANASITEELKNAHKVILKRARQYSSARNSIAHGVPVNLFGGGPYQGLRIKQGDKVWHEGGVSQDQLLLATGSFQRLDLIAHKLAWSKPDDFEAIEQCHRQALALPSEAFPLEEGQTPTEAE